MARGIFLISNFYRRPRVGLVSLSSQALASEAPCLAFSHELHSKTAGPHAGGAALPSASASRGQLPSLLEQVPAAGLGACEPGSRDSGADPGWRSGTTTKGQAKGEDTARRIKSCCREEKKRPQGK